MLLSRSLKGRYTTGGSGPKNRFSLFSITVDLLVLASFAPEGLCRTLGLQDWGEQRWQSLRTAEPLNCTAPQNHINGAEGLRRTLGLHDLGNTENMQISKTADILNCTEPQNHDSGAEGVCVFFCCV